MAAQLGKIILGSRSPRRAELLQLLIPAEQIEILTPANSVESGFQDAHTWREIERLVSEIARTKNDDVIQQLEDAGRTDYQAVLTADTVIVCLEPRQVDDKVATLHVLGQPHEEGDWQSEVRRWFKQYYFGRDHWAVTALCLIDSTGWLHESVVRTTVTFRRADLKLLDWYLSTKEPLGKAGGYAIQEAGSMFVESIEGSLTNVVGLPLESLNKLLKDCEIDTAMSKS
ncbi:Maf family protein [Polystyrenella longa]|nr:Maf family protein [Polystyrenella longa]